MSATIYGGLFASDDVIEENVANTKFILVQAEPPAISYFGETWVCTSSDPPLLQTYDAVNEQWMKHHSRFYHSFSQAYKTLTEQLDGGLSIQHDSGSGADTYLYFKANGLWWGVKAQ